MEATKVIHLHLKGKPDASTDSDWYYGSLKAIYDQFDEGIIGIRYKSLTNAIRGKTEYENKKVIIRVGKIRRKARENGNTE